ncbi:MAG: hypothetical protein AB8H86_26025 [Polyangiales bacterium]
MLDVLEWLDNQLQANNPTLLGLSGAIRTAEAAASLRDPDKHGRMAFGLAFECELVPHAVPLIERAKVILSTYIAKIDREERERLRHSVGEHLATLGLTLTSAPAAALVATHQIVVRYPAELTFVDGEKERASAAEEVRCFDGVQPAEGFDVFNVLENVSWVVDAEVELAFEGEKLWCKLLLWTESAPSTEHREALLGPISDQVWDSSWSWNLEWDDEKAKGSAGLHEDIFVNVSVLGRPDGLKVQAL